MQSIVHTGLGSKDLNDLGNMKSGSVKKPTKSSTNYFIARENCIKGCICNKERTQYNISIVLWEYNQVKLLELRNKLSDTEKDELIKIELFHCLKQSIFNSGVTIQASNQRFPLVYQEIFIDPSTDMQLVYNLCEDCWILFNNHKGY